MRGVHAIPRAALIALILCTSISASASASSDRTIWASHDSGWDWATTSSGGEQPALSPDGRYVAFVNNTIDHAPANSQIMRRDLVTGDTALVSDAVATDMFASGPSISRDGRYVAFATQTSVYRKDVVTGASVEVSASADGHVPVSISADGARVAFVARTGDDNVVTVRDLGPQPATLAITGDLMRSSAGSDSPSELRLSGDGQTIVWTSAARYVAASASLGAGNTDDNGAADVFARAVGTGAAPLRVMSTRGIAIGGGASGAPTISADGVRVAFESSATNLDIGPDGNASRDVFVRKVSAASTLRLVSRESGVAGAEGAGGDSASPAISADGRAVAFVSSAANLLPPATDGPQVLLRDLGGAQALQLVSRSDGESGAAAAAQSELIAQPEPLSMTSPAIAGDDDLIVAFATDATNLNDFDSEGVDVFVRAPESLAPPPRPHDQPDAWGDPSTPGFFEDSQQTTPVPGTPRPAPPTDGSSGRSAQPVQSLRADEAPPRVTKAALRSTTIRVGKRATAAKLGFILSEPAVVRLSIYGAKKGSRRLATATLPSPPGRHTYALPAAWIRHAKLKSGRTYRLTVQATDDAGNRSRSLTIKFKARK